MFAWSMSPADAQQHVDLDRFFDRANACGDYMHVFDYHGRRVTRRDLEFEQWQNWQAELNARLRAAIAFLYGNFVRGVRRLVVDGVEPAERPHESIQLNLFEYVYHQILRKDPQWVARDLFREKFLQHSAQAAKHEYEPGRVGCMLLCTSQEAMLDDLISRPLDEGDALSNANTLIYMGRIREGQRILRGLYIAKHRGSACTDRVTPYKIGDHGIWVD
jgi:hypothetical protein